MLYWRKLDDCGGYEALEKFLQDFYRDCGVNEVPFGYSITIAMQDIKPYQPQDPERVLKQRIARLDKKMDEKFPLFAEEFKAEHKETYKDRYDVAVIAAEQQERKELIESTDPEVSLPAQMDGADTWKQYDWKALCERRRRIMFANKRHIAPAVLEKALQKERKGQ